MVSGIPSVVRLSGEWFRVFIWVFLLVFVLPFGLSFVFSLVFPGMFAGVLGLTIAGLIIVLITCGVET